MMTAFLRKLMLFLTPFALVFVIVTGALVYIGESMPLALVVAHQQAGEVLYRPTFGSRDPQYKLLAANTRRAPVLAVGSSRVLQMRDDLLTHQPQAFYNAGAPAWQLEQVDALVRGLNADALPEILIIGVDPVWFNADYVPQALPAAASDFDTLFSVNRSVLQDIIAGRWTYDWGRLFDRRELDSGTAALGSRAIINGHGFRSDGSEQYGDFLVGKFLYPPTERQRHLDWLDEGAEMYVHGNTPDADALARFESLLDYAQARDVRVIAFAPPYTPTLYARMTELGNHAYMAALHEALRPMLESRGFAYFDFSDGGALDGVTDEDFFDGWHGSERVYLRLFIRMIEALPDVFAPYVDVEALRARDAAAPDTFRVF